jgi:hypothetical protein
MGILPQASFLFSGRLSAQLNFVRLLLLRPSEVRLCDTTTDELHKHDECPTGLLADGDKKRGIFVTIPMPD